MGLSVRLTVEGAGVVAVLVSEASAWVHVCAGALITSSTPLMEASAMETNKTAHL